MRKSQTLFLTHFCFPWRRPCDYHAICCMDGKTIQCSPNPSQHVHTYLQQFPSYFNRKWKKSPFSRTATHTFVSPGDAPAIITQYVAWMERQFQFLWWLRKYVITKFYCNLKCEIYPLAPIIKPALNDLSDDINKTRRRQTNSITRCFTRLKSNMW